MNEWYQRDPRAVPRFLLTSALVDLTDQQRRYIRAALDVLDVTLDNEAGQLSYDVAVAMCDVLTSDDVERGLELLIQWQADGTLVRPNDPGWVDL